MRSDRRRTLPVSIVGPRSHFLGVRVPDVDHRRAVPAGPRPRAPQRLLWTLVASLVAIAAPAAAQTVVNVSTAAQLQSAVAELSSNTTIVLAPGTYTITASLTVNGPLSDVTFRGATGRREDVVIVGPGLTAPGVVHGITTSGDVLRLTVTDLTIRDFPGSTINLNPGVQAPHIRNVHLANSGDSFINSWADPDTLRGPDDGIVEQSLIEYIFPALAPHVGASGIRIRGGRQWRIRGNTLRRIWESNQLDVQQAAILSNLTSIGTIVEHNTIIDAQRGISFGQQNLSQTPVEHHDHIGGIIRNNMIYRSGDLEQFGAGDVAIHVADSPDTRVSHNTILQGGTYPNSIEYRFSGSTGVVIRNNLSDRAITARTGAANADIGGNVTTATPGMFVNPTAGDLHLLGSATAAINQGIPIVPADGAVDFDGETRPTATPDVGADEFNGSAPVITTSSPLPTGFVGVAYNAPLTTTTVDNQWSIVAGTLPPGLVLTQGISNANVTGTPTATGIFGFRVRVTHVASGAFDEKDFLLTIQNPPPTLTSISPSSAVAGSGAFALTATGTGFVQGSVVRWNGSNRTTSFVSPTQLTAAITAADVAAAGNASVTVFTPAPGGGISASRTFTILTAPPGPFTKQSPANGATGVSTNPTLSWTTSTGAGSYEYCIDTTNDNACSNWTSTGTATSVNLTGLANSTTFFWHVRAQNAGGTTYADGAETAFRSFTTKAPDQFTLTVNGGGAGTGSVTSQAVSPAIACTITAGTGSGTCVAAYQDGTSVVLTAVPAGGSAFTGWSGACTGTGTCSVVMTADRTVTATFALVTSFSKLSPANGATGVSTSPTLSWATSTGATSYEYCVDTTNDNACTNWTSVGTNTSVALSGLAPSTTHYWHVRSLSPSGTTYSNGSATAFRSFTTQAAPAVPTITTVTPASGPLAGGTHVTIAGTALGNTSSVTIGGVAAVVETRTSTSVVVTTPAAIVAGARDVVVVTPAGTATETDGFSYEPERLVSLRTGEQGRVCDGDSTQPSRGAAREMVAFVADCALLAADTNDVPDIMVSDHTDVDQPRLVRVSVSSDGTQANGPSGFPRISRNGRFVAFWSDASNLVPDDTNGVRDVFVHDRDADNDGVFDETEAGARATVRVSVASNGVEANLASALPVDSIVAGVPADAQLDISPDGGFIVFRSEASNLVPDDSNGVADIFRHARTSGQTIRVSAPASGAPANGQSQSPAVSEGGRFVAFASDAANLVAGDANGLRDIFLAVPDQGTVIRLSEPQPGVDANGPSDNPSIDDRGDTVVAQTLARNLVPALASSTHSQIVVFTVRFVETAALRAAPNMVAAAVVSIVDVLKQIASLAGGGGTPSTQPANGNSTNPEVCGNGGCVGYASNANNLDSDDPDTNGVSDGFMQRLSAEGVPSEATRVSRDEQGNQATAPTQRVSPSHDGSEVAMQSNAALTADTRGTTVTNVFLRQMPLSIAGVSPSFAQTTASDIIAVTGSGFEPGAQVFLGSTAVPTTVDGPSSLRFTTPTGVAAGVVDVTVRNPDGSQKVLTGGFSFVDPAAVVETDEDGDKLPDSVERTFGLDPTSPTGDDGPDGDPDADGRTNAQELAAGTHPRGFYSRFLAEGATGLVADFTTRVALANPSATTPVLAWLRFQRGDGTEVPQAVTVPPLESRKITVNRVANMQQAEFSTVVESDGPLVVDRQMWWDSTDAYGSHAEAAVTAPATVWYLAEGATHTGFELFYLLQNPSLTERADVKVRYLLPTGAPLEKTYSVGPRSRFNIWVDFEEFPAGSGNRALAATDVSAVFEVQNNVPIIVERAMYLDRPGERFAAGHESAGVTAPALSWFLAEGAAGPFFDLFVLLANPSATAAEAKVTYLLEDGRTFSHQVTVPGNSRQNIWVDYETLGGAAPFLPQDVLTALSTTVEVTNGVPIIVERAMWWPGGPSEWYEAHNSPGSTVTGTLWGLAEGAVAGPTNTYILAANTDPNIAASVNVTLLFEDGLPPVTRTFNVAPSSRLTVDVHHEFPETLGRMFGALVESLPQGGNPPAQIIVERAMYNDVRGRFFAAGSDQLATRIR